MKRIAISIVLNAETHLNNWFNPNSGNWYFHRIYDAFDKIIFVEGASANTFCTSWCNAMPSEYHINGRSIDNTINIIKKYQSNFPEKIELITHPGGLWDGKLSMFNAAVNLIKEPCWLWQVDIDEYWKPNQLESAELILTNLQADVGAFSCDYLLSDEIIVRGTWGESIDQGYTRLWNYQPGRKFISHEPPAIEYSHRLVPPKYLPRFKHLSYYYDRDVKFKSDWYGGHENVYRNWRGIIQGKISLPCSVEKLFGHEVQPAWKNTIITYA